MSVKLKTASNGSVTLAPEDTASDVTLTVPAGTSSLVSNTTLRTELNATGTAPIYACRAWVNFNGTGTVAIRESGNVSSITDNGTGDYTVNFTTAMEDVNYAANVTTQTGGIAGAVTLDGTAARTTTALRLGALTTAGNFVDSAQMSVSIFR